MLTTADAMLASFYNYSERGRRLDQNTLQTILAVGETVAVEFKRCGNGIESDTYETVCSFLNRFGGDIFLGVLDDGTVMGLPEKAAPGMVKNFISVISNPNLFSPTVYLAPEIIMDEERRTIIHIRVPSSGEVHSYKKVIYDRVNDSDVKVTATTQIAQMYIRKQNIYTERRIYPYVTLEDLRLDLLPRVRQLAVNYAGGSHPWTNLSDEELLISAGLYGVDHATGQRGYNLVGIMLLGKDPELMEGDVFRINVPLDDAFSFDYSIGKATRVRTDRKTSTETSTETDTKTSTETSTQTGTGTKKYVNNAATRSTNENRILDILQDNPLITMNELSAILGLSRSGVQYIMDRLKEKGLVKRIGAHKNGSWSVNLSAIHDTGIRATQNDTE